MNISLLYAFFCLFPQFHKYSYYANELISMKSYENEKLMY